MIHKWPPRLNLSLVVLVDSFKVHRIDDSRRCLAGESRAEYESCHQGPRVDHSSSYWAFSFWNQLPYMPPTWASCLQDTECWSPGRVGHIVRHSGADGIIMQLFHGSITPP